MASNESKKVEKICPKCGYTSQRLVTDTNCPLCKVAYTEPSPIQSDPKQTFTLNYDISCK
jgi:rubrerythrin